MGHRIDNTHISLMRNHPVDTIFIQIITFCNRSTAIRHVRNCIFEYSPTFLIDIMHVIIHRKIRRRTHRSTSFHMQKRQAFTIGSQKSIHDTHIFSSRLYHKSSRTIAKNRTCSTFCVVHHRWHLVCTYNNDFLVSSRTDKISSRFQQKQEAATGRLQINSKCIFKSEFIAKNRSCGREVIVWSSSSNNNQINVVRISTGFLH